MIDEKRNRVELQGDWLDQARRYEQDDKEAHEQIRLAREEALSACEYFDLHQRWPEGMSKRAVDWLESHVGTDLRQA